MGAPTGLKPCWGSSFCILLESRTASPTESSTDPSPALLIGVQNRDGTTVGFGYCNSVFQILREMEHGAPAGSNLPGLLVCGLKRPPPADARALESFRPRLFQHQPLRPVLQRIFVAVGAV